MVKKTIAIYGIKNCDTMKKTFQWFDKNGVAYTFHDYKKSGADAAVLKRAINLLGWETVINRKGTTWRGLPDGVRDSLDAASAARLALETPSVIKRPLIVAGNVVLAGYDEAAFSKISD
jgi:arsenate reductase